MIIKRKQTKNKVLIILLFFIALFTLSSCEKSTKTIDNVIAIGYLKDDIYLINSKNESLLLEGYDLIQESLSDYMYFRKDNKYGYVDIHGKEIIKPKYDKAYAMSENKAVVVEGKNHIIINSEGNKLYTLPSNVTSSSYFSNDKLVIEKDGKYNYLTFNKESNTFSLPGEFLYDFAGVYSEGFAVVGFETTTLDESDNINKTTIKFNYLSTQGALLFSESKFDEAEPFTNGYAKVGIFKKSVKIQGESNDLASKPSPKYRDLTVYNYITPNGGYLIDASTGNPLECHYGETLAEGVLTTALIMYFESDEIENNLFKSYTFYSNNGTKLYETCFRGTKNTNVNIFWPTNLIKMGAFHVFALGKGSTTWTFRLAVEGEGTFLELPIQIDKEETWVNELAHEYYLKNTMIEFYAKNPFHISNIIRPSFSNDTRPITIAQVNFNDNAKYGILQLNYDEDIAKVADNLRDPYTIYYLIPPIYDRIVF